VALAAGLTVSWIGALDGESVTPPAAGSKIVPALLCV